MDSGILPDIKLSKEDMHRAVDIVLGGGAGKELIEAGIKTSAGKVISSRHANRIKNAILAAQRRGDFEGERYAPEYDPEESPYIPPIIRPQGHLSAVMDIETTIQDSFRATHPGSLLCVSFLPFAGDPANPGRIIEGPVKTFSARFEDRNDRRLLVEVLDYMMQFDRIIGHNVKGFDLNKLNTLLIKNGLPNPSGRIKYYCTLAAAKRIGLTTRKSLEGLGDFFQILDRDLGGFIDPEALAEAREVTKKHISYYTWAAANSRHRDIWEDALAKIIMRCETDIWLNKRIYDLLWPRDTTRAETIWPRYA